MIKPKVMKFRAAGEVLRRHSCLAVAFFVLVFAAAPLKGQYLQYQFSGINVNNGLSNNQISAIFQDSKGFMWFGTMSGLNRYDGYTFKVFKHDLSDSASIDDDYIQRIEQGPNGKLWIQTRNSFNIYNPVTETFNRHPETFLKSIGVSGKLSAIATGRNSFWINTDKGIFQYPFNGSAAAFYLPSSVGSSGSVTFVAEDRDGNIWLVYQDGTLEQRKINTKKVLFRTKLSGFPDKGSYRIFIDKQNDVWVYSTDSAKGLFYINPLTKKCENFSKTSNKARLNANMINSVVQDDKGLIWIGTDHGGINLLNKKNWTVNYLLNREYDEKSLAQNSTTTLYKDNTGIIWVGTFKKGISYFHENIFKFPLYTHQPSDTRSLPYNDVNVFVEDSKNNIWIGTNGGGLIYFDRKANSFKQYRHEVSNINSLSNDVIVSLCIDHEGKLWIGTYFGGLDCYDGKKFVHYRHQNRVANSVGDDRIWEIMEDSDNNLWIGTLANGLDRFDRQKHTFTHFRMGAANSIHSNYVSSLVEDKTGNIWIGTSDGLDILDKASGKFIHYAHSGKPGSLSNNNVIAVFQDSRGIIWIATRDGLNIFNPGEKTFRALRTSNGLPDNTILTILEDNAGNLWVSTPKGLSNIIISKNTAGEYVFNFKNYDEMDGLQDREFNENAALKTYDGELIFGGPNGFNIFRPQNIRINRNLPALVFTDFELFNKSVTIGQPVEGRVVLPRAISLTKEITLSYDQNEFSLEFAALNFSNSSKNRYAYMLEGFSHKWTITDDRGRKATYTNLDPGDYIFRVKASNDSGIWDEKGIALKIKILPPFWKTPLAYIAYFLIFAGILYAIRRRGIQKLRNEFALERERLEAQRMHDLDLMKIKFFTNVSHEFRTPLSLILAPLDKILPNLDNEEQKAHLSLVQRNAKRLLNLVNQLLDFRKMEVQELKLHPKESDIIQFIRESFYSFTDLAEKKHIKYLFRTDCESLTAFFDEDKIERILFNLLSNAFKFTPEQGTISLIISTSKKPGLAGKTLLEVSIQDTGIGIPKEKQDKIFERFFQNETPGSIVNQGSGIGLSITKEFVSLHGGTIAVESDINQGSCFTFKIPLQTSRLLPSSQEVVDTVNIKKASVPISSPFNSKKPTILIVEDNEDFRFYLQDNLKQYFNVLEASNGKTGWAKALSAHPDLIVSDISMPEMDGTELCKKIRQDERTNHIPLILLTALSGEEQQLRGLKTGANDYLTKPFNFEILLSKIRNLILQQQSIKRTYQKQVEVKLSDVEIESSDEKFIQEILRIVEENISNTEFSVEALSRQMLISRVSLYQKILALTGKTPLEFIRSIRLKRAAQLLEKSKMTISEVAFECGFNNPKIFARYFKQEFGVLPSGYAEKMRA